MKRVAAPMLGGLVTSAFLTLEVLPVLYTIWRTQQLRRSVRNGIPLESVIGAVPAWARPTGGVVPDSASVFGEPGAAAG